MSNISINISRSAIGSLILLLSITCEPEAYEKGIPAETVIMKDKETADVFKNFTADEIEQLKELLKLGKSLNELAAKKKDLEKLIKLTPILEKIKEEMVDTLEELYNIVSDPLNKDKKLKINGLNKIDII